MAQNHINYLSRDFESVRADIVAYARQNYSQLSDNFGDDTSISSFLVDVLADCVDSLNYHIDRTFQDTQINSTNSRQAVMNIARVNGLKIPGSKAGMCEVQFSCVLPVDYNNDNSQPNWNLAPVIQRNCVIGTGNLSYTIDDNVDFREQFNKDAFPNRKYTPNRDANGQITGYTVTKSAIATTGQRRIYKKVLSTSDVRPFMEVMLPDSDVMNVESVIFKSSSNLTNTPEISEYYVDAEQYIFMNEGAVTTYRFFEVDSLSDQWRWGPEIDKVSENVIQDRYNPEAYVDYSVSGTPETRIYKGEWKPVRQKFITEFTDNGYMKLIFGPGVDYKTAPDGAEKYSAYRMCEVINNDMLGVLPSAGWTMYVLYNVGGGVDTNVAKGAINTIKSMQVDFPDFGNYNDSSEKSDVKSDVLRSISVTNSTPSVTGKDTPSTDELKYIVKYNNGAQSRCVTLKDYEMRLMMMPPKYGSPFRCSASEENNKIVLSILGLDSAGMLVKSVPNVLSDNIVSWLSHFKGIGDYVEIKSGKIYNIGFLVDAFIDKSYNASDVISSIIGVIRDYFDVNRHMMGEDIFVGNIYKDISMLDGVVGLIDVRIYKISGSGYSSDVCPLPSMEDTRSGSCGISDDDYKFTVGDSADAERIDIDAVDSVLLADNNAMYEIKNPNIDIKVRVKQK